MRRERGGEGGGEEMDGSMRETLQLCVGVWGHGSVSRGQRVKGMGRGVVLGGGLVVVGVGGAWVHGNAVGPELVGRGMGGTGGERGMEN